MNKRATDITAMALMIGAFVTGLLLHRDVNHRFVYDNYALWYAHEAVGLLLAVAIWRHGIQHRFWFKNYAKIPKQRKRVTTIFLAIAVLVVLSGIILMCGSQSTFLSRFHYITAIICILLAIGHTIKRWKIFTSI